MIREDYIERREEEKKYILELAQNIRSFKEMRASVFGMSIRSTYSQAAFLSLKLNDLDNARIFSTREQRSPPKLLTSLKRTVILICKK